MGRLALFLFFFKKRLVVSLVCTTFALANQQYLAR